MDGECSEQYEYFRGFACIQDSLSANSPRSSTGSFELSEFFLSLPGVPRSAVPS